MTEAELQEIQVQLEDVENNSVPLSRFVEYMTKTINEHKLEMNVNLNRSMSSFDLY